MSGNLLEKKTGCSKLVIHLFQTSLENNNNNKKEVKTITTTTAGIVRTKTKRPQTRVVAKRTSNLQGVGCKTTFKRKSYET